MTNADIPEADALEQAQPVDASGAGEKTAPEPRLGMEVPEADALEQAQEVPHDEDDSR